MELWDQDAIELLGSASIEVGPRNDGKLRFIAVEGWMDIRHVERDGARAIEFSWEGNDEGDPASGRGWAVLEGDGSLAGHLYIHGSGTPRCGPLGVVVVQILDGDGRVLD